MTLRVSELFYAPQGEGARAGEPSVFVRLQGCSAKHACFTSGVRCDTEFESGSETTLDDLLARVYALAPECRWVVWTGGEPLDQLTVEVLLAVRASGYHQAIETSGARPLTQEMADALDWIAVSPKVAEHVLTRHFGHVRRGEVDDHMVTTVRPGPHVDELRYVRHVGQGIPHPALTAAHYYLSPHANGSDLDRVNVDHCIALALEHPTWRVSVQMHKAWRTL